MGLLDFLKNRTKKEYKFPPKRTAEEILEIYTETPSQIIQQQQTILSDESKPLDERNAAYLAVRDEEIRRLNEAYDFNSIEGVKSIPVPCQEVNGASSTGRVEYYLRGECFKQHWDAGRTELALACLRKAQDLMYVSEMIWKRSDFLRLVIYLYKAGKNEEAEKELERLNQFFSKQDVSHDNLSKTIDSAKYLETDLIEAYSYAPYCEECAKYINRIYSISGKDKRFPALKNALNKCKHDFNCLSFSPFIYGVSEPTFECGNIIQYSNRPFKDERTCEKVEQYKNFLSMSKQEAEREAIQEANMIENAKHELQDIQNLEWLQVNLPKLCPKSLSGFRRMRTTNSKNYQKLVEEAAKLGKDIH